LGLETTFAGVLHARRLASARRRGYRIFSVFIDLPSAELAIERVRQRVLAGGHSVPDEDIERHFDRAFRNFIKHYQPLSDFWVIADNSTRSPELVAWGWGSEHFVVDRERCDALFARFGQDVPEVNGRLWGPDGDRFSWDVLQRIRTAVSEEIEGRRAPGRKIAVWEQGRVALVS
jgi:hypothetical protein